AIRGYYASDCCAKPDGTTAYLSLYQLRTGPDFGGLGYDLEGVVVAPEARWGAGPVGAYQSVNEFGVSDLAIGLYIAENGMPDGLQKIAAGEFDAEILHLSEFIKTVPGRVFLRIGYEFDGTWNAGQENTDNFIAAHRRIVDVLRADGVTNGVYVWQASASILDDLIEKKHEDITRWYPGDDYVDWFAFSWFSLPDAAPTIPGSYQPKRPIDLVNEVTRFARQRGKPVLIAESAPQGYDIAEKYRANINPLQDGPSGEDQQARTSEQIWDEWYAPLFAWMNENADIVRGLAYINVDWDSQPMWGPPYGNGFWGDSRLQANAEIAERFNAALETWRAAP
ncbi:MAG: hypothetical protein AAFR82_12205, partial [Pseudomonadota bacterium]